MKTIYGRASCGTARTLCIALFLLCTFIAPLAGTANARSSLQTASADFPVVDPLYIYQQLAYLTSHFQRREAGYVANQGHDRFAAYWEQEMAHNLQGFGPQINT